MPCQSLNITDEFMTLLWGKIVTPGTLVQGSNEGVT